MDDEKLEVACACFQAFTDKDRQSLEALIADDFRFTSPVEDRIDRQAYFERCWPASRLVCGYEFVRLATDGNSVFVTYECETISGNRFRNTEVITVSHGRIVEIESFLGWDVPRHAATAMAGRAA